MNLPRLTIRNSAVLVIDIQEKLLAAIPSSESLLREVSFLLDVANHLEVPTFVTEQYPKGLGPTHPEIARRLKEDRPSKLAFSCCGAAGLLTELKRSDRPHVILLGMETHVCVMQTALDLLTDGLKVFLPVDGVASRFALDHETAIRRMEWSGVIPTTVESIAFEWLGGADHPQFKPISQMVRQRDQQRRV
ncbi:MAG: isochorismatase family protein [Gemmataceae bacterium]|jgi:nicotinamidase-related amidase|nr:isochorismatase family protein [Gemmataceae bacterium]